MNIGIEITHDMDFTNLLNWMDEIYDGLSGTNPKIKRTVLNYVSRQAATKARNAYFGSGLADRSGNLRKSIKYKIIDSDEAIIAPWAKAPTNKALYGFAHIAGSQISPKHGDYMKFQIDGKWVSKGPYKLTSRDLVVGPVRSYMNSAACHTYAKTVLDREIAKIKR